MRLGMLVKAYRQLRDLTATQMAAEIGVTPGVILRLERGDEIRSPALAAVLGWLLSEPKAVADEQ